MRAAVTLPPPPVNSPHTQRDKGVKPTLWAVAKGAVAIDRAETQHRRIKARHACGGASWTELFMAWDAVLQARLDARRLRYFVEYGNRRPSLVGSRPQRKQPQP